MRKALVVGIDYYHKISSLTGCVNDAHAVKAMLDRNSDGSINFGVKLIAGIGPADIITRKELKDAITQLFDGEGEVALLYFAGHGHLEATGGYLCAGDCETGDDGVPLSEVMVIANRSRIQNRVIVLDSCHSGIAGNHPSFPTVAEIEDGVTILTASTAEQYALEENGGGVFTSLFVNALGGEAANLVGDITPGAVYAHVDQSLGPWVAQRPVFKTNVKRFVSLRRVEAPLPLAELRRITEFFPVPGYVYQLDPSYEPLRSGSETEETPAPDPENNIVFAILQNYRGVGLVVPEGVAHMWDAAMQSKTVRLTALGEHYRRLVSKNMI
jgi:hypothetical protein